MANDPKWMEHAAESMKKRGTVGSFGKATTKKISAGLKAGGKMAKKAAFAKAAKKVASK
jgi:hypothetical protein